jgi:hypothetical protein
MGGVAAGPSRVLVGGAGLLQRRPVQVLRQLHQEVSWVQEARVDLGAEPGQQPRPQRQDDDGQTVGNGEHGSAFRE